MTRSCSIALCFLIHLISILLLICHNSTITDMGYYLLLAVVLSVIQFVKSHLIVICQNHCSKSMLHFPLRITFGLKYLYTNLQNIK